MNAGGNALVHVGVVPGPALARNCPAVPALPLLSNGVAASRLSEPVTVVAPLIWFVLPANALPMVFATATVPSAVPKLLTVAAAPVPSVELPEEVSVVKSPVEPEIGVPVIEPPVIWKFEPLAEFAAKLVVPVNDVAPLIVFVLVPEPSVLTVAPVVPSVVLPDDVRVVNEPVEPEIGVFTIELNVTLLPAPTPRSARAAGELVSVTTPVGIPPTIRF